MPCPGRNSAAATPTRFETEIAATPDSIRAGLHALRRHLCAAGAGPALLSRTEIVLAEVLNNIAEHAYAEREQGRVRLSARLSQAELRVVVRDRGGAMPAGVPPGGTLPARFGVPETLPEGGFGWFLIHDQTDTVRYRREGDENHLALHFYRHRAG